MQLSEGVSGPGILPPEWGSQNDGAMAKLDALWVADCSLFGPLPSGWGTQLPSLWQLSAMNNQLIGAFLVPSTAAVRLRNCEPIPRSAAADEGLMLAQPPALLQHAHMV